jgi:hypothetical protein
MYVGLSPTIQRTDHALKESSFGPPMKEDREVLSLHATQQLK